jgi:hypothetical protein
MTHNIDNVYKKILKVINNGNPCLHVESLHPRVVSANSKHNKSHNTRKRNTNTNIKKCKHFFSKYSIETMFEEYLKYLYILYMSRYFLNKNLCAGLKIFLIFCVCVCVFFLGTKLHQLVRGKKRRNTISTKDFIGKNLPNLTNSPHFISRKPKSKSPNLD